MRGQDTLPESPQRRLQRPALAVDRVEQRVGFLDVGNPQVFGVPRKNAVLKPHGKHADEDHLGQRAAVVETGAGGLAVLAGPDPVLFVGAVFDPGQRLGRLLE